MVTHIFRTYRFGRIGQANYGHHLLFTVIEMEYELQNYIAVQL